MSANACIAFYGIRFEIESNEIDALEARSDARLQAARKAGLKHYWANFGLPGERYLLFVGAKLGMLGPENSAEVHLRLGDLHEVFDSTKRKLAAAGMSGEPALYLQWLPDA
jgi:hypothetical protein